MHNKPSLFFDKILTLLSSNYNRTFSVKEVVDDVYKAELKKETLEESISLGRVPYKDNTINAILFLCAEGFVIYDPTNQLVTITTKGFVKIKTEGFDKEIKNKKINLYLQRGTWVSSIIALILSVLALTSKNLDNTTTSINCTCNTSTPPTAHKGIQKSKSMPHKTKLKK